MDKLCSICEKNKAVHDGMCEACLGEYDDFMTREVEK